MRLKLIKDIFSKLLLLVFIFITHHSISQNLRFNHLTPEDGLTTGNVRSIIQDYQGFFWFGTEDGLLRYDGYDFTVYAYDQSDSTSLSSNFVLRLFEDSFNNLWVATLDGGINLYNRETNSFRHFYHDDDDSTSINSNFVRVLYESSDHRLYISAESNVISYVQLTKTLSDKLEFSNIVVPNVFESIKVNWGSAIVEDPNGNMLFAINGGNIHSYDPKTGMMSPFQENSILMEGTQVLTMDSKNRLWVGTWNRGIYVYDFGTNELASHVFSQNGELTNQNQVEAIQEDFQGNIWIGTDDKVKFISADQNPFDQPDIKTFGNKPNVSSSLLTNTVKSIFLDVDGRIWISCYFGGVSVYDSHAFAFNPITTSSWDQNGITSNNVTCFAEDKAGGLWIGTDGGGLNYVPSDYKSVLSNKYKKIDLGPQGNKIKCIDIDSKGNIWVGTWGSGIFKYDSNTGSYEQFKAGEPPNNLSANEVMTIKVDNKDNLWIGTFGSGLNHYDAVNKKFNRYLKLYPNIQLDKADKVISLHIDSNNKIWVGGEVSGLSIFVTETNSFEKIVTDDLRNDITVLDIHESKDSSVLWLGTNSNGLIKYDMNVGISKKYSSSVKSNVIHSVNEDENGKIWLGTNEGISRFDPSTEEFTNFRKSMGLVGSQFNNGGTFRSNEGVIFFGGTNGMNAFFPQEIEVDRNFPKIVFTQFWMSNIESNIGHNGSPMEKNIIVTDHINLSHDQNSISIGFAALDYTFADRIEYAYFLEGFDDEWQYIGKDKKAVFTNLPPSVYELRVKTSNSDGIWGDNGISMTITIQPAWWQTIYFKFGSILLILAIVLGYIRYRTFFLLKEQMLLEKVVDQRTQEISVLNQDLEQSNTELIGQQVSLKNTIQELKTTKSKLVISEKMAALGVFTAGIAHEINNPINFISGATEKLFELIDEKGKNDEFKNVEEKRVFENLQNIIQIGIKRTTAIVNSLRNYANNSDKFETYNIVSCLEDSLLILSHKLAKDKIKIIKDFPETLEISCLPGRMSQLFINLIGNAIDAINSHGEINITLVRIDNNDLAIRIGDTGCGIDEKDIPKLFDPFYSTKEVGQGIGLGLYLVYGIIEQHQGSINVKSSRGIGTVISITLPAKSNI